MADWVTDHIGKEWITDSVQMKKLELYADDKKAQHEFMNIKYQNKLRLAEYIKEHNGIEVDPRSIFDVQVKRLHEYKRQVAQYFACHVSLQPDQGAPGKRILSTHLYLWRKGSSRL